MAAGSESDCDDEQGLSNQMCPEREIAFRVTHQLIHKLEEGKFMVKEYTRPAADKTDHCAVSEQVWTTGCCSDGAIHAINPLINFNLFT